MSWQTWADELRHAPQQAVANLLRGSARISPFERAAPHEFLLAILPRSSRLVTRTLLGEPRTNPPEPDPTADLPGCLDAGLCSWLLAQRQTPLPAARKLGAYSARVCEALQWPVYFALPQTHAALKAERARWLPWLASLTLTAYRDPEYDYWQTLAAQQDDDGLQFFWQSFVVEAGRTRSSRYLNLGLLALARLPLSEEDSLRNLRLQVQALVHRYQRRKGWGVPAQQELADNLRGVMIRNLSMGSANYRAFLQELLSPLGEGKASSVLSLLGLNQAQRQALNTSRTAYRLQPPAQKDETDQAVQTVGRAVSLAQAWNAIRPLLTAHEDFLHKSGDHYSFVRTLDRCARALCEIFPLRDPEIQQRLFQWIHLALCVDADNPRLWMLWQLALRQADQTPRAQWVLWEMTRRFPDNLPCRVELARLLAESAAADDQAQAQRLLQQVLQLDPNNLHAHSTLAKLAIRRKDWPTALEYAKSGLDVDAANQSCAVLQASAYARRNGPNDLQTAIDQLQHFVTHHPNNRNAEDYLRDLRQRQQKSIQGRLTPFDDDATPTHSAPSSTETDPAWLAFAESIRTWVAASTAPQSQPSAPADLSDRVLPLPLALRQAVTQQQWTADVLADFDGSAQQEFPLETRLWRYLQALQTQRGLAEREQAKQAVQDWMDTEAMNPTYDSDSWLPYLRQQWSAVQGPPETALAAGADLLQELLDRYQPLPAPLLM